MEEQYPLVSVVILTYGQFEHLDSTLASIDSQHYKNLELILADDGSPHFPRKEIEEKLSACASSHGGKYQICTSKTNTGTVKNCNRALDAVTGDYIKLFGCGDGFYRPDSLSILVDFLRQHPGEQLVASMTMVCGQGFAPEYYPFPTRRQAAAYQTMSAKEQYASLARRNAIGAPGVLFRRSFFAKKGAFDESYRLLEDWPMWLRFTREGGAIPVLDAVTAYYTVGGISSKSGSAFDAPALLEDMLHCYEQEILPFVNSGRIRYQYALLRGEEKKLQFLPYRIWQRGKKMIKTIVTHRV